MKVPELLTKSLRNSKKLFRNTLVILVYWLLILIFQGAYTPQRFKAHGTVWSILLECPSSIAFHLLLYLLIDMF